MADMSKTAVTWGVPTLTGSALQMKDEAGKTLFEIPYKDIANSQATKTDFSIQLSTAPEGDEAFVTDLKFSVPSTCEPVGAVAGSNAPHVRIVETIEKKLSSTDVGDLVVEFEELQTLAPRGIYSLQLFKEHLKIRGKASRGAKIMQEWTMPMEDLSKGAVYFLDSPTEQGAKWMCLSLAKPIKVGAQMISVLTFQVEDILFEEGEPIKVNTKPLSKEQTAAKTKDGTPLVQDEMTGLLTEIIPKTLRALSGTAVVSPLKDHEPMAVSDKTGKEGYLYLLDKSFFFAPSPSLAIPHSSLSVLEFEGVGSGSNTVRLTFKRREGGAVTYGGMAAGDVPALVEYCRARDLVLAGLEQEDPLGPLSDESSEEDYDSEEPTQDTEDSSDDAAMVGKKRSASGKEKKAKKAKKEKKEKKEKKAKKEKKDKR